MRRIGTKTRISKTAYANDGVCCRGSDVSMVRLITRWCDHGGHSGNGDSGTVDVDIDIDLDVEIDIDIEIDTVIDINLGIEIDRDIDIE